MYNDYRSVPSVGLNLSIVDFIFRSIFWQFCCQFYGQFSKTLTRGFKLCICGLCSVLCGVYGQRDGVYIVTAVQGKEMEITHLNSSNGEVLSSHLIPAPWILRGSVR